MRLPEAEELKVREFIGFVEKVIEFVSDSQGSVDVEDDADQGDDDHQNIQNVPE